jgi:hypothetical protein
MTMTETQSYYDFVATLFNKTGDPSKDFSHAVLGVATEISELGSATDGVNHLEELGDLMFFCVAIQVAVDRWGVLGGERDEQMHASTRLLAMDQFNGMSQSELGLDLHEDLTRLMDIAKRWIGYAKEPTKEQATWACAVAVTLPLMALLATPSKVGISARFMPGATAYLASAKKANMDKLAIRYKDKKFSQDAALNRDLNREREVLFANSGR